MIGLVINLIKIYQIKKMKANTLPNQPQQALPRSPRFGEAGRGWVRD